MGHSHHHHHGSSSRGRLAAVLVLVLLYMAAEIVGGLLTGSLALLADAAHMASDAAALGLALFALWFSSRPSGARHTYGFHRTEILAALVNGAALLAVSAWIVREAIERLGQPTEVGGWGMVWVASGGLVVNLVSLVLLHGSRGESLNLKAAWLHVLSDALGSVQAVTAGLLVELLGWTWADPVASLLIATLVVISAWGLLKEAVSVLMESAPGHLDVDEVREAILSVPGVEGVHDLHVWSISSGRHALSAHVDQAADVEGGELLAAIQRELHGGFGLDHLTIQLEPSGFEHPHHDCDAEARGPDSTGTSSRT